MAEREREAVKVIVRCRPMNKREKDLKSKAVVFMDPRTLQCSIQNPNEPNSPPKNFTFDGVYHTDSTTEAIYNDNGFDLVEGVLEGYNGTVFAYGQTGCGKSFSMQGIHKPETQRGIIPRAFEHVFESIDAKENMKYLVHASYLEIYNEDIRDLLGTDIKKKLDLKEHPDKGVYINDISLHPVHNTKECENLMEQGWKNRATGSTNMNSESSRSHSIFTINIEMLDTGPSGGEHIRKGKLNLVDLAGSERQSKTGASGDRLKEATKINLSLSALGNVISALVDGKSKHIPYRDSKLTRLLQDSLGGNTKTMMVACLSPADNNYEETLSTLRYANRAKNIKNKPKINQDPKDALLMEYQSEIQKLKELLALNPSMGDQVPNEAILEAERERVRSEYEQEMEEMRKKFESEQQSKAKIQKEVDEMKKQYEEKLAELNERAKTGNTRTQSVAMQGGDPSQPGQTNNVEEAMQKDAVNLEQQEAMIKLKKLQASMVDGGKRAGDTDLKERRLKRKKAAEKRLKALGEALGHVDDEDGVLVKVYDDIQEELNVKTAALKKYKKKILALNSEIGDLQYEFEKDRTDYLDTIRKQDQQILLFQQIMEKVQPTIRKDCNYSNLERIKQESVWNDENQRWKVPDLIVQKTKLPPAAGVSVAGVLRTSQEPWTSPPQGQDPSEYLQNSHDDHDDEQQEEFEEDDETILAQKLARSEEEDVVGNYFKPKRATRLVAQAQETKRAANGLTKSGSSLLSSSNSLGNSALSSSYNSGLNTSGLNNSYGTSSTANNGGFNGAHTWGPSTSPSSWAGSNNGSNFASTNAGLGNGGGGNYGNGGGGTYGNGGGGGGGSYGTNGGGGGGSYGAYGTFSSGIYPSSDLTSLRKPSRLEALPTLDRKHNTKKKSMPMLNTMGTF